MLGVTTTAVLILCALVLGAVCAIVLGSFLVRARGETLQRWHPIARHLLGLLCAAAAFVCLGLAFVLGTCAFGPHSGF